MSTRAFFTLMASSATAVGSDGDIHGLTAMQCSQCVCGAWYHFFRSCVLLSCFKQHNFCVDQQYTYV